MIKPTTTTINYYTNLSTCQVSYNPYLDTTRSVEAAWERPPMEVNLKNQPRAKDGDLDFSIRELAMLRADIAAFIQRAMLARRALLSHYYLMGNALHKRRSLLYTVARSLTVP